MVEELKPHVLKREISVKADLVQIAFRKLREVWLLICRRVCSCWCFEQDRKAASGSHLTRCPPISRTWPCPPVMHSLLAMLLQWAISC